MKPKTLITIFIFGILLAACQRKAIVVGPNTVHNPKDGLNYYQKLDSTNYMYQHVRFTPTDRSAKNARSSPLQ